MSATHTQNPTDEKLLKEDTEAFVEAMRKMASGEIEPGNETIGYLLEKLKDTQAEIEAAQKQLLAAQESITSLRGRSQGIEKDLLWIWKKDKDAG